MTKRRAATENQQFFDLPFHIACDAAPVLAPAIYAVVVLDLDEQILA